MAVVEVIVDRGTEAQGDRYRVRAKLRSGSEESRGIKTLAEALRAVEHYYSEHFRVADCPPCRAYESWRRRQTELRHKAYLRRQARLRRTS
jgi:hypothetical protein